MRQTKSNARQNVTKHLGARTIKIPINNVKKLTGIGFLPASKATRKNTHGLSQKIQGTYFKISALYFKIYALYFSPFQIAEKQCLEKRQKSAVSGCGFAEFFLSALPVVCARKHYRVNGRRSRVLKRG